MKKFILSMVLLLLLSMAGVEAQTVVSRLGQLSVQGSKIQDQCGRTAQLKGMSYFWHFWGGVNAPASYRYMNTQTIKWLRDDWKVEIVRIPISVRPGDKCSVLGTQTLAAGDCQDNPTGITGKQWGYNTARTAIQAAIDNGIYIVVDWHAHPNEKAAAKEFFATMAQEFGQYPNVIYEIYNEPTGSSWENLDQTWPQLKEYSRDLIATIRQYDPDNLIICPTPFYDQFVHQAAADPITVDKNNNPVSNIAYTLHVYADAHRFDAVQGDWAREALSKGLPMFVTESGATGTDYDQPRATGRNAPNYTEWAKWETWWDQNGISYCKWSLSNKDEFGSSLLPRASATGNWNYNTDLTDEGRWNRDHFRAVNTLPTACTSSTQAPFFANPQTINNGSVIKAYTYDKGGQGVAFNDTDDGNHDGCGRTDNVDVAPGTADCAVGWIVAGEWLEYTVNVTAGTYNIKAYMASPNDGRTMRIKMKGTTLGTVDCPSSSTGWDDYKVATLSNKTLTGGQQVMRLEMVDGGFNLQKIVFEKILPATYQAENAVLSGTNIATAISGYSGSGYVGGMDNDGDKMTFTVNVPSAGAYPITVRYSECEDQQNYLVVNGTSTNHTFTNNSAGCGGWDTKVITVNLNAGSNTIAIRKNWGYMEVDYIIVGVRSGNAARYSPAAKQAGLPEADHTFNVYPNPLTQAELIVQPGGSHDENAVISIIDLAGRKVFDTVAPADRSLTIQRAVFKNRGMYIITVQTPTINKRMSLIVD